MIFIFHEMDKVKACFNFVNKNQPGTKFPEDLRCSPNVLYKGNTLAMYIFETWKCDCEEWMRHDIEISNNKGLIPFMVWLENIKTFPPEWTYKGLDPTTQVQSCIPNQDFGIIQRNISSNIERRQNVLNEYRIRDFDAVPVMFWIKYTTLDIPEFIKVHANTIDKNGETCMFYWIKYRKGQDVPEFLRHNPLLIRNDNNETAAMMWIKINGTEPPQYLMHNPHAVDNNGDNLAMYWLKYSKTPLVVPDSLHFTELKPNKLGNTFKTMWYQLTDEPLPDWVPGSILLPKDQHIEISNINDIDKTNLCQFMAKINYTITNLINIKSQLSKLLKEKQELEYSMLIESINNDERLNEINSQIETLMNKV